VMPGASEIFCMTAGFSKARLEVYVLLLVSLCINAI